MISKKEILTRELKKRWLSNREMCDIIYSAHADRRAREIRENTPAGYKFARKTVKFKPTSKSRTIVFDKYKLVKA